MKKIILSCLGIIATFNLVAFNQVSYLKTTMIPCSWGCDILGDNGALFADIMYAQLNTGANDSLQYFIGTATYQGKKIYWQKIDSESKSYFIMDLNLKKDASTSICHDTIQSMFKNESEMALLEVIHDPSTNELRYIWLDDNSRRTEHLTVFPFNNPLREGRKIPNLTLEKLNGEFVSTRNFAGKILVINWWSTWSEPSLQEMSRFNMLVEQYRNNSNVVFLAIADNRKEEVENCLSTRGFKYIQTLASEDASRLFKNTYPKNLVIDRSGVILYSSVGEYDSNNLDIEEVVDGLLNTY